MAKEMVDAPWQQASMLSGWSGYAPGLNNAQAVQGSQVYSSAQLGTK